MKQSVVFLLLIMAGTYYNRAVAQGENNIWHFGKNYSIDFNQDPPQLEQSNIMTYESCSSVSDAVGNLLFYTIGSRIWDAAGDEMPNSGGLLGNGPVINGVPVGSSANGVAILPNPANAQQYYVFSGDAFEDGTNKLYYSLVDMTLNGGMGDVVPGVKNIELMSDMSEFLTVTYGEDCRSYWLIARHVINGQFHAFKVDATGINPIPVISTNPNGPTYGAMVFAPDGVTLALGGAPILLSTFNRLTGALVDFTPVPANGSHVEFSPSGSKLYFTGSDGIHQVDLALMPDVTAVAASDALIYALDPISDGFILDFRRAPDGKIYSLKLNMMSGPINIIGCIQNPEISGTGCNFNPMAFPTPPWAITQLFTSFGQLVPVMAPVDTVYNNRQDTVICSVGSIHLSSSLPEGNTFLWSTGSTTPSIEVQGDGLYWVRTKNECTIILDSFLVQFNDLNVELGPDTLLCIGDTLVLHALQDGSGVTYEWNDGSEGASLMVYEGGMYTVNIQDKYCTLTDSVRIDFIDPELAIQENDTSICHDIVLELHGETNMDGTYLWNTGETEPKIYTTPGQTGYYILTTTNICGTYSDSIYVTSLNCQCVPFIPNAFSPNGDGKNDVFSIELTCPVMEGFSLSVFNRYGQKLFVTTDPDSGWDGMDKGRQADVGVYFYYIIFKGRAEEKFVFTGDLTLLR